jgi:2-dehydro-3-deoxyphosphogluconate aldolase / (4S)-4-hydroxy-2-oxoglutarate aldolase
MNEVLQKIERLRIVPMIAMDNADRAAPLADALVSGGLPCAEITFRTNAAESAMRILAGRGDILLGAGTVLSVDQVDRAVDAGCAFLVSPGTNPRVVEHALSKGIAVCPGVATPTDIELAMSLGCTTLKFFPAGAMGGPGTLKAVSAPYAGVRFIPTGGIKADNLADYLALPSVLAVGGSWLAKKDDIAAGNFDAITHHARQAVQAARAAKGDTP